MNIERKIIIPDSIPEQLLYSTVRISGDSGIGTGFFFRYPIGNDLQSEMILTNKHVIDGNKKLQLYFHESEVIDGKACPTNQSFLLTIDDYSSIWVPHPDKDVDLGALLFVPIRNHALEFMKKEIFSVFFDSSIILDDDTLHETSDVAEDVLMIGYPTGLWDDINNFPILRKGITASHPALDFQNKKIGVVDIACFPGSSGSPVLIYRSGTYYQKKSKSYAIGGNVILLGLLSSGPMYTSEGKIEVREIPVVQVPIVLNTQMIHLGYYVKSKEILALCEHIKLIKT